MVATSATPRYFAAEAAYIEQYLAEKYRGVADVATILQLAS